MKFLDIYHKLWWNIADEEGLGFTWEEGAPNPDWISVFGRGKMGRGGVAFTRSLSLVILNCTNKKGFQDSEP